MIDFGMIIRNSLWILGLSILLATWSYARYAAYREHLKTRQKLGELKYSLVLDGGLLLFVAGMAATEPRSWARLVWIVLGVTVITHAVMTVKLTRSPDTDDA